MTRLLVLNAGSSSIKLAVFDGALTPLLTGLAEGIGGAGRLRLGAQDNTRSLPDHETALGALLDALSRQDLPISGFTAAAHRVVHGGAHLTAPMRVTDPVLAQIEACSPLAPLHNPHNLSAIRALQNLAPDLPQFVSFDTSFHATNPDVATRYAIPRRVEAEGIRRYGFHGLSYASLVDHLPRISGAPLPRRLLALHLGNGASLCAIANGRSVATTMGYSPLDGLTMGTRAGGIDANAVLRMVELFGLDDTRQLLNNRGGLLALSGGLSDMRALLADPRPEAAFAVDHFVYWALRHAGSLIAAMQGLEAVAFTGGIGENAAQIRARIMDGLAWLGLRYDPAANAANAAKLHATETVSAWIVPAREEARIAADALSLLDRG